MPRGYPNSSSAATIVAADRILRQENQFRQHIEKLHSHSCMFAESISISGTIEEALCNLDNDNDNKNGGNDDAVMDEEKEQNEQFLQEQRLKLKSITEGHVQTRRYVEALVQATKSIKDEMIQGGTSEENSSARSANEEEKKESSSSSSSTKDYESILQSKIEIQKHEIEKNSIAIENESMYRKIREKLNEKLPSNRNDDDEIEVEFTQNNQESAMKCPLTGMLFNDPVKNKLCGHVYERSAIKSHLRIKRTCPVMGCRNENVTMEQVEPDEEMKLKVRSFKRVMEQKRKRDMMSQDYDIDDDEEEYGGADNGMTVIE